jgi:hypothetical protein
MLKSYGLSGGLAGGVGLSAVAAAGVVVTVLLIDRVGRRPLAVLTMWLCTVLLAIIGLWAGAPPVTQVLAPETKGMKLSDASAGIEHGHLLAAH